MLDVTLDRHTFIHLRALAPRVRQSVLSPLVGPPTPDRKAAAGLRTAGLVERGGRPTAEAQEAAGVLSRASTVAEVEIAGQRIFGYAVYRPGRGQPVSVTTVADGLRVQQPATPDPVIEMVSEMLGRSRIAAVPFEVQLPVTEALVLAALMDSERAARLTWLGGGPAVEPVSTPAQLAQRLTSPTLVDALVAALPRVLPEVAPSEGEVSSALDRLSDRGLALRPPDGWRAGGDPTDLAGSLLVVEKYVTVRAASLDHDGALSKTVLAAAFSGAHGVLTAETDGEVVRLRSVAPYEVTSLAAGLLAGGVGAPGVAAQAG